jgi:hypothetical protein
VTRRRELLAACLALFAALLVWPLLSIPNRLAFVAGVPLLVVYLFTVWAAIVVVLAWAARRPESDERP